MKRAGINQHIYNVYEALIMTPLPYDAMTGKEAATLFNLQIIWGNECKIPGQIELNNMVRIFSKYRAIISPKVLKSIEAIKNYRNPANPAPGRFVPARSGKGRNL